MLAAILKRKVSEFRILRGESAMLLWLLLHDKYFPGILNVRRSPCES
jgi:hypothetical protein